MLNSETLEVGIGMAFLFLLVSIICTAVKEWLEGVFKWRAMDLERALRTLLDDPAGAMTAQLYRHPLVDSLFQGRYDPAHLASSWLTPGKATHIPFWRRRNLPSYIPAASFATAFLDLVARGPLPSDSSTGPDQGTRASTLSVPALRDRALALPSPYLRRVVLTAIDHSADDLDRVRLNVQRWFDSTMDRASGWYKRRTQAVLFMLGLGVAVALNVDALHVLHRLTADKTYRDAIVKSASEAKSPESGASAAAPSARIGDAKAAIDAVALPIGWNGWTPLQLCADTKVDPCRAVARPYSWFLVVLGWLVTAFAVMLGAPFWFDVLNKFMVIRSTVKPHEKSPEEGSQDRPDRKGPDAPPPPPALAAPAPAAAPTPTSDPPGAPATTR